MPERLSRLHRFILFELWELELAALPRAKRYACALLKVVYIVATGFISDNCALQAAALTFTTLMSTVPVLALVFAIAKGLGFQDRLRSMLDGYNGMPEQVHGFIGDVLELVSQTNVTALGIIGLLMMFWTVISVLGRVEGTFNSIWGVHTSRTWVRKFSDYTSVLLIVPLLVLCVTTVNAAMSSPKLIDWLQQNMGQAYVLYQLLLRIGSASLVIVAFSFLYVCLPNTRVKASSAVIGGVLAGLIWLVWQWVCIRFQIGIANYSKIYGAFAGLPISLFWLNTNWMIVLLGAEISFAWQHYRTYADERLVAGASFASRRKLAYYLMHEIGCQFHRGEPVWRPAPFHQRFGIPIRLIHDVLDALKAHGVLAETDDGGYVPAKDLSVLTLKDVEMALQGQAGDRIVSMGRPDLETFRALGRLDDHYLQQLGANSLADLIGDGSEPAAPAAAQSS